MEQQIAVRAKEYALSMYPDMRDEELQSFSDCRRDYAHGAREQRKIDIDNAVECFELAHDWAAWSNGDWEYAKEQFKKAMEGKK